MLTKNTVSYIGVFMKIGDFFAASPFSWDNESCEISAKHNCFRQISWKIWAGNCLVYLTYLTGRLITEIKSGSHNYSELSFLLFFWLGYLWGSVAYYSLWRKKQEMITFFKELKRIDSTLIEENNILENSKWSSPKITELIFLMHLLNFLSLNFVLIVMYVMTFPNIIHLVSLLPKEYATLTAMFICSPFEILSAFAMVQAIYQKHMYIQLYICVIPFWTDVLSSYKASENMISKFHILKIVNQYFNKSLVGGYTAWHLTQTAMFITFSMFATIRLYGRAAWTIYALYPTVGIICVYGSMMLIYNAAQVYERSLVYINTQKSCRALSPTFRRKIKSLRPFGVRFGILRSVKYLYLFAYYLSISNYVITFLIALPASHF